jgi:hypothetical protein
VAAQRIGVVENLADLSEDQRQTIETLRRHPWRLLAWGNSFRLIFRVWPLFVIVIAYGLGSDWAPATAGEAYFSAAAQVIPVLLLALAVESRMFSVGALFVIEPAPFFSSDMRAVLPMVIDDEHRWMLKWALLGDTAVGWINGVFNALGTLILGIGVLLLLSLSEWDCLSFLASPSAAQDPASVSGGLLAGLVGVGLIALVGRYQQSKAEPQ